jgi:predicted ATP-binding protein involved in virulence
MSQGTSQKIQFGLRGVGNVELNLATDSSAIVFFGSNGVGKTRCLETLYLLSLIQSVPFNEKGRKVGARSVPTVSVNGTVVMQRPPIPAGSVEKEWVFISDLSAGSFDPLGQRPVVYFSAGARANLPSSSTRRTALGSFHTRKEAYLDRMAEAIQFGNLRDYSNLEDPRQWFVQRAHSVNTYQKASDSRQVDLDAVMTALHEVDERIDPKGLQVDGDERVFLKIDDQERELSELSSGFVSLVRLIQGLVAAYSDWTNEKNLRQVRGVAFIDEIESHLHPKWQTQIVGKLQSLFPKTNFFIATHSPLVLSRLKEGEAYLLERDADGVVRSHPIESPSKRVLADLLKLGFDVDLNKLKRSDLLSSDQQSAKAALLKLLEADGGAEAQA